MGKFVDSIIAYRILHMLVTPFESTEAFRLGIIDKNGKELKHMRDLNTVDERDSYTLLHRLVYRLKRIINKVPIDNKRLVSFAAAYSLVKEEYDNGKEPMDLETKFLKRMNQDLTEEMDAVTAYFTDKKILSYRQFTEEDGGAPAVAANNAMATAGVQGLGKDVPVSKKGQKRWTTANAMFKRGTPNV
jgi:hypothetical protein